MSRKPGRRRRTLTLQPRNAKKGNPERDSQERRFSVLQPVRGFTFEALRPGVLDDSSADGYHYLQVTFRQGDEYDRVYDGLLGGGPEYDSYWHVILNSDDDGTANIWIGKLVDVRASSDRQEVMTKVHWYYSRKDVADHIKSFDPTRCSLNERLLSDEYDFISPYAFQAATYVHEYDEAALDQPEIGPNDFYVRSQLFHHKKQVKPLLGNGTCSCQEPYVLYPAPLSAGPQIPPQSLSPSPSSDVDVMHFCPSLDCRKWYHSSCLTTLGHVDRILPAATRSVRLLAVDPDQEVSTPILAFFCEDSADAGQSIASDEQITVHNALEMFDRSAQILSHLPPPLLTIAQSPIVRCSGAPNGWAVGNVADVVIARRFVYTAMEYNGPPYNDLNTKYRGIMELVERLDILRLLPLSPMPDNKKLGDSAPDELDIMQQLCDDVAGLDGLLATPYPPYWEKRLREFEEMEWMLRGPAFVCPQCRGAI